MKWLFALAVGLAFRLGVSTASAQWVSAADAPGTFASARAVTDANGDIHVLGLNAGLDTHWVYKPSTDEWTSAADIPVSLNPNTPFVAATLDGTRIYFGAGINGQRLFIYDVTSSSWEEGPTLPIISSNAGAAAVGLDGRLYVTRYTTFFIYDPNTNKWTEGPSMPVSRRYHAMVCGSDGRIYAIGGYNGAGYPLDSVSVYDPQTNTWASAASIPRAAGEIAAVASPDRTKIAVLGGASDIDVWSATFYDSVYVYDVVTGTWTEAADHKLTAARGGLAAAFVDCKVFAIGGYTGSGSLGKSESNSTLLPCLSSTTTLTATPIPSVYSQTITLTATVTSSNPGATPAGTVFFKDENGTTIGTVPVGAAGQATLTLSTLDVGTHTLTALYQGQGNHGSSKSNTVTVNVQQASTTTTLTSSVNPSLVDAPVKLTATVTALAPSSATPAGTVTFFDGTTALATVSLTGGVAEYETDSLSEGDHVLRAEYNGTSDFAASSSSTLTQTVSRDAVAIDLTFDPSPVTFGGSVVITAKVSSNASGLTPTGTVTFTDGSTTLGTTTLAGGVASITVSALRGGTHTIQASYGGDTHHKPGVANASLTVNPALPGLSLAASPEASVSGQAVTLTASTTPIDGVVPTGHITFRRGFTVLATVALDATGSASFTTTTLGAGTHEIVARYVGDGNYSTEEAGVEVTVGKASTSVSLAASARPSAVGASVTFTATVTAVAPGAGTPTGTVTFRAGSSVLGQSAIANDGTAKISTASLPVGDTETEATYDGDANFLPSSQRITHSVTETATGITVTSSKNPSVFGESVTFVIETSTPAAVPTGTITLSLGDTVLGTGVLDATGRTSIAVSSLPVGTHTIVAHYPGDGVSAGVDGTITQTVDKAPTTTTLTVAAASKLGDEVVLTANVATSAPGTPTGKVTFFDGTTILATVDLVDGVARFTTKSLALGPHALKAEYTGDDSYLASASSVVTHTVQTEAPAGDPTTTPEEPVPGEELSGGGCSCRQTGAPTSSLHALALLAGAVLFGARRRRLS